MDELISALDFFFFNLRKIVSGRFRCEKRKPRAVSAAEGRADGSQTARPERSPHARSHFSAACKALGAGCPHLKERRQEGSLDGEGETRPPSVAAGRKVGGEHGGGGSGRPENERYSHARRTDCVLRAAGRSLLFLPQTSWLRAWRFEGLDPARGKCGGDRAEAAGETVTGSGARQSLGDDGLLVSLVQGFPTSPESPTGRQVWGSPGKRRRSC